MLEMVPFLSFIRYEKKHAIGINPRNNQNNNVILPPHSGKSPIAEIKAAMDNQANKKNGIAFAIAQALSRETSNFSSASPRRRGLKRNA